MIDIINIIDVNIVIIYLLHYFKLFHEYILLFYIMIIINYYYIYIYIYIFFFFFCILLLLLLFNF